MVDGQNELKLDFGETGGTPDAAAEAPAAEDGQGDAGGLAAPEAVPETAPEAEPPEAGDPATSQPAAVIAANRRADVSTGPPDVPADVTGAIARAIGERVDATVRPVCTQLDGIATATLASMKTAASEGAELAKFVSGAREAAGEVLQSVEAAAAATAGPDGWTENFLGTQKEFALFRKDITRLRSYESRVRRWVLRILLAVAVLAVPLAFLAGGFAQRDLAVLDFGREAGFRRAWSDWIWRHHSTGLLDCALEARRRGEALTCQIRMAPPQ